MKANITNKDVAIHLGLDYTSVSRIRSGERQPSLPIMMKIEMWLEWSLSDQALARYDRVNVYATELEKHLAKKYGEANNDGNATAAATSESRD